MKRTTKTFLEDLILILAILIIILVVYFVFFSDKEDLFEENAQSKISKLGFSEERINTIRNKVMGLISNENKVSNEEEIQINDIEKQDKYKAQERLQRDEQNFNLIDKNFENDITEKNNESKIDKSNQIELIQTGDSKNSQLKTTSNITKQENQSRIELIPNTDKQEINESLNNKEKDIKNENTANVNKKNESKKQAYDKKENIKKETKDKKNNKNTKKEENENVTQKDTQQIIETESSDNEIKSEAKKEDIEKNQNGKLEAQKINVSQLFKKVENKIYEKIRKDFNKDQFDENEIVNIRITILKNGKIEELTFVSGNEEYFNEIASSIKKSFPIEIESHLKQYFPRYYRIKLNFKNL